MIRVKIDVSIFDPIAEKYYTDTTKFRTRNFGASRAAEVYPHIREIALDSLKGVFDKKEIEFLLEILKLLKDHRFVTSASALIAAINDNIKFISDEFVLKGKIGEIVSRIETLDDWKVMILTEFLSTFLSFQEVYKGKGKVSVKKKIKFDDYINRLS